MSELPQGWSLASLGMIAEIATGSTPKRSESKYWDENGFPWLTSSVTGEPFCNNAEQFVSQVAIEECRLKVFKKSTLLLAMYGEGKTRGQVTEIMFDATCNQACAAITVDQAYVKNSYVKYRLVENYELTRKAAVGGNQPNLNLTKVRDIPVPIAPLAEQKRIVEKLDEVLAQVDTIKARLDGIPELLKRFRQSVLASAVSGKLTEEWRGSQSIQPPETKNLGEVISKIGQGWSPKCENVPAHENSWGVIKTSSVQNISFLEFENKALPKALEPRIEHELIAGDILTTRAGPRVRCGVTAFVDSTRTKLMICDKVYRYQVKESEGLSKYLVYLLNAPHYMAEIEKMKTGISDSGMNLTQTKFKQLPLLWPFVEEQKEIVRLVDQYFAFADTIETQVKKAQARVDNLTQSILAKAFRGELVAQDPSDEPADKLLERIADARADAEALAKAAKKARSTKSPAKKRAAKSA